jgi:hypothetical protein
LISSVVAAAAGEGTPEARQRVRKALHWQGRQTEAVMNALLGQVGRSRWRMPGRNA